MTPVYVAIVSGIFALATIVVQAKVHRDNRNDHADTAAKVDQLLEAQGVIGTDLGEMKVDMREARAELRDHGARLRAIESPEPAPAPKPRPPRKKAP